MPDAREPEFPSTLAGHGAFPYPLDADLIAEPLDPNEIRIALGELRDLMSRIRSAVISRDLRTAYDRIAGITVHERLPGTAPKQHWPVLCRH